MESRGKYVSRLIGLAGIAYFLGIIKIIRPSMTMGNCYLSLAIPSVVIPTFLYNKKLVIFSPGKEFYSSHW